ncbi:hypothetical protein AOLI_G00026970 [Acnodon oligacanthus]
MPTLSSISLSKSVRLGAIRVHRAHRWQPEVLNSGKQVKDRKPLETFTAQRGNQESDQLRSAGKLSSLQSLWALLSQTTHQAQGISSKEQALVCSTGWRDSLDPSVFVKLGYETA